jgi:hypothetical protein
MESLIIMIQRMVIEYDFGQFLRKFCFVGETPLLVAVKRNDEIMVQFLLDLGANPDVTDFKV